MGCGFGWINLAEKCLDVDKMNKRMWNQKCEVMESVKNWVFDDRLLNLSKLFLTISNSKVT